MAPILQVPVQHSNFKLDASGVAGFFGGEEAISAMSTVHLYKGRKWVGWYNMPGSYTIGKYYGRIASSRWWDGLFPGPNNSPAKAFGLDGKRGPKYIGMCSGTKLRAAHLAQLFVEKCKDKCWEVTDVPGRRKTTPNIVSVVELKHEPTNIVPIESVQSALLAIIPIFFSFMTCVLCTLAEDWWAASLILLGIVAGGVSCYVIGSGKLILDYHSRPSAGVPPGDGFLHTTESNDMTVVLGPENLVNVLTKGTFKIKLDGEPEYRRVGLVALLLETQFFFQLLFIPQATLFGQIMFVTSLAVSWVYTSYLSSKEKDKIQADLLWGALGRPKVRRYNLATRGDAATFIALVLKAEDPEKVLAEFLKNDTRVWNKWRKTVSDRIKSADGLEFSPADWNIGEFSEDERKLYELQLISARDGYRGYRQYCKHQETESEGSTAQSSEESVPASIMTTKVRPMLMSMSTLVSLGRLSLKSAGTNVREICARLLGVLTPPRRPTSTPGPSLDMGATSVTPQASGPDTETRESSDSVAA
ncbi:hypothetical protein CONPUDRAFT_146761 [Coniophora puteana RWD-64-598 SS2]|uniref:Uncharacterized protein n=1 Tax=Coniophora puteana (strain RWD-64-598) TaxID=741705 RepID=A0A5M3MAM9_CONPW|nr:uncharacterized protein CONPUDRAFT_146761 [Coniophora puteana RWD-64-598 SS2]EIW76269.1 hypothetical protein CONPUDRAFT_146761 [Coniophora puteana RWD-64-598 SS2]